MGYALLWSGQGLLAADTLAWVDRAPAAQPLLQALADAVGSDWRERLGDAAWRSTNRHAQPLVVGLSLAAWQLLGDGLPPPEIVAGYSVGELSALAAAGACPPRQAIQLATQRAAVMDDAAAALDFDGGLMAVDLPRAADFEALAERFDLPVAIDQAAGRQVLGGPIRTLEACAPWVAARGGLARPLEVRVPSHTRWMAPAAAAFGAQLSTLSLAPLHCPMALNVSGSTSRDPAAVAVALGDQIAQTLRWQACCRAVAERGVDGVLEIGPGSALARLWQAAHPDIPARAIGDFRDAAGALAWLQALVR